eukprot:GHVR01010962.1.p1 GENE.GHVR01010962.1~~GHVR01010962.1.p1  ORF type:complete len:148 (+),score=10.16 GHVR01010962.1:1972-2415(+)
MACTTNFQVSQANTFNKIQFQTTDKKISATNVITLGLEFNNPISSTSYLRIVPNNALSLTYQYVFVNPGLTTPSGKVEITDLIIGNLTSSTTSSPSFLVLGNFTLTNPPYANKPATIVFKTQNLVSTTYYNIDESTVQITSIPSTIT